MRVTRCMLLVLVLLGACASEVNDAQPSGRRNEATEWYLRSISEDDRTINLVYTMSGVASDCERKGKALLDESGEKVSVTARKSVTLDRNRACTEELGYVEESVILRAPLGTRALVGCRPGRTELSEDTICRDLERSRQDGIFEFPAPRGG